MEHPDDFGKLKSNASDFHKLELNLDEGALNNSENLFEIRCAIEENQVVREVHVKLSKEFVESYPIAELNKLMLAIGKLPKLKYLCLGQMTGNVETFGTLPVQSMTTLLQAGGEKVLWLYMRGMILTHIYKGSEEEKEDKGDLDATIHDDTAHRSKRKSVKKKKDKDKDKKKKKSSKKDSKKEKEPPAASTATTAATPTDAKLLKKQNAAKRALDKLGDALVGLKNLKRISLNGHFDDCMLACQLDPFFEGLGSLEELELLLFAMTRHQSRVKVDPSSLGGFFDSAPKIKEFSLVYTELSDDHIDEIASGITKSKTLEEVVLSGTGESPSPDSVGALFRAPYLKKLTLKELTLDTPSVVAMSIALVRFCNLQHLEIQCALDPIEMVALQQMIMLNTGIETLHLHMTALDNEAAPLDLVTATMANPQSKLTTINVEGDDKIDATRTLKDVDLNEWREIVSGVFTVEPSNTLESYILSLKKNATA